MHTSTKAAALLAATVSLSAAGASPEPRSITECIPMSVSEGKLSIYALCDASAVNKKWNLKIDPDTKCAVKDQEVQREGMYGWVHQQGSFTRWTDENKNPAPLRECTDDEAISFAVEL